MSFTEAGAMPDRGDPDLGKTPEEIALEREIAEHAVAGREDERGRAADRLAYSIMRRTLPLGVASVDRAPVEGELIRHDRIADVEHPMCGACRSDLPVKTYTDGQEMQCPRCGQLLWFEVRNGIVTQHPGKRARLP
jgi:predicted RNA-binding Zn-ribbon protein involved in translation (DUF1610 family)